MPVPNTPPLYRHETLTDRVYRDLETAILSGELGPGLRLNDKMLEKLAGASRTPIREALRRLSRVGLVEIRPQAETRVSPVDLDHFRELMTVARHLYGWIVREAVADFTEDDLEKLGRFRDRVDITDEEVTAFYSIKPFRQLLDVFVDRKGNDVLRQIVDDIRLHVRWISRVHSEQAGILAIGPDRAEQLITACRAHDASAAEAIILEYFDTAVGDFISAAVEVGDGNWGERPRASHDDVASQRLLLRDNVYRTMLAAVTDGTFLPGERLNDPELMQWLGVSRTPLREALTQLEDIGLVEIKQNRGTRVALVDDRRIVASAEALGFFGHLAIALALSKFDGAACEQLRTRLDVLVGVTRDACDAEVTAARNELVQVAAKVSRNRPLQRILELIGPGTLRRTGDAAPLDRDRLVVMAERFVQAVEREELDDAHDALNGLIFEGVGDGEGRTSGVRPPVSPIPPLDAPVDGADFNYLVAGVRYAFVAGVVPGTWSLCCPLVVGRLVRSDDAGVVVWRYALGKQGLTTASEPGSWERAARELIASFAGAVGADLQARAV
ncbi:GntR family transcriptional regulator [Plantibacter sp. YIM 135347]|uniref:GntR family transcriptional regulator n=1 Tax=Plantibacter sp. YIM 135347 TaxID=3423919 RepID=UPI003D354C28